MSAHFLEMFDNLMYDQMVQNCKNFNGFLLRDRKSRIPFIDQHTGLAQSDCRLWLSAGRRLPAACFGQLFSYPAARWLKRRRCYLSRPPPPLQLLTPAVVSRSPDPVQPGAVSASSPGSTSGSQSSCVGENTRSRSGAVKKKSNDHEVEGKKPWQCDLCPANYKTRSGLVYHFAHCHKEERDLLSRPLYKLPVPYNKKNSGFTENTSRPGCSDSGDVLTDVQLSEHSETDNSLEAVNTSHTDHLSQQFEVKRAPPSEYCDFCLGDSGCNKKTGLPEQLVSCAECGRSGHPVCLEFTENMIISVSKYRWQCIECKCCSVCGSADNDEKLLFCDDCDRGYHVYCLSPPLVEPPEGVWSCHTCLIEFH